LKPLDVQLLLIAADLGPAQLLRGDAFLDRVLFRSGLLRFTRPEFVLSWVASPLDGEADERDSYDGHSDGKGDQ
jgi:hypothetical protein